MERLIPEGTTPAEVIEKLRSQLTPSKSGFSIGNRPSLEAAVESQAEACPKCQGTGYELLERNDSRYHGECVCWIQRDTQRRLKRIGPRDRWATIETLQPCADQTKVFSSAALQRQVISALGSHPDGSFAFFGPSGVGKTTYLAALYRRAVETQRRGCFYIQVGDLVRQLRDVECGRTESAYLDREVIREVVESRLRPRVFLDEFDKVTVTDFARNAVRELIDELYRLAGSDSPGAQLVLATELDRDEFAQVWGGNVLRRVEAVCEMFDFFAVRG